MKFKIIMGYFYLASFVGFLGWKFWDTLRGTQDAPAILLLIGAVILGLALLIRKMVFEN